MTRTEACEVCGKSVAGTPYRTTVDRRIAHYTCLQSGRPHKHEDTGRYSNGYRVFRDGSYREDFRSDC